MNVYDFDNTIYDGESGVDLFKYFLKKDPGLMLKIPWALSVLYDYKYLRLPVEEVINHISTRVEEYGQKKVGDLRELARDFWDGHSYKLKLYYFKQRTEDDVIISACLDFILQEVCDRMGIKTFIGSEVDLEKKTLKSFCFRENKVKMFRERFPGQEIENLYTDSYNDQPLMEIAKNVYLVKGDKITKIK